MALTGQLTSSRAAAGPRLRRALPNVGLWAAVLGFPFLVFFPIVCLVMIPSSLTLLPRYVLVKDLGMLDTPWVLMLPWTAQSMAFGVLLCRSFFATLPEELFEAGRIDGASELQLYRHVAVPLSYPI